MRPMSEITVLLARTRRRSSALNEVIELLYDDMKRLARARGDRMSPDERTF